MLSCTAAKFARGGCVTQCQVVTIFHTNHSFAEQLVETNTQNIEMQPLLITTYVKVLINVRRRLARTLRRSSRSVELNICVYKYIYGRGLGLEYIESNVRQVLDDIEVNKGHF